MDFSDLVQKMKSSQQTIEQLSYQQEEEITDDLLLMLITLCALNHWNIKNITTAYHITEETCIQKLLILDRMNIIQLLPHNKIKLLISPNFSWRENGPIQRFFQDKIGQEYFHSSFAEDDECLFVLNGMLSHESSMEFQRKVKRLVEEFHALNHQDSSLDFSERNGTTFIVAMRQWNYELFSDLRKM